MGRDRCGWSGKESDSVGNPRIAHSMQAAAMREAQVFCTVLGGTEKCVMV